MDFNIAQTIGIVDSNIDKQNVQWNEITVYNPTIIQKLDYDYIIISPFRYEEIVKECQRLGVEAERIISFWNNKNQYIFLKEHIVAQDDLEKFDFHMLFLLFLNIIKKIIFNICILWI